MCVINCSCNVVCCIAFCTNGNVFISLNEGLIQWWFFRNALVGKASGKRIFSVLKTRIQIRYSPTHIASLHHCNFEHCTSYVILFVQMHMKRCIFKCISHTKQMTTQTLARSPSSAAEKWKKKGREIFNERTIAYCIQNALYATARSYFVFRIHYYTSYIILKYAIQFGNIFQIGRICYGLDWGVHCASRASCLTSINSIHVAGKEAYKKIWTTEGKKNYMKTNNFICSFSQHCTYF